MMITMATLPWSQGIVDWFFSHRTDLLTDIMIFFTTLGNEQGYILIVAGIYWLYDHKLAIKLAMVIIISSLFNHILKIIIRNPRPYYPNGGYEEKWGIPKSDIASTADSYSTPSGHAMGSSSFWTYLHLKVQSRFTFVIFIPMIFLIGISRPYLGVHYLEDVILGWILGLVVVWFVLRYEKQVEEWWAQVGYNLKLVLIFLVPLVVLITAGVLSDYSPDGEAFATFGGLFSGLTGGLLFEAQFVGFDPKLPTDQGLPRAIGTGVLRYLLGVLLVFGVLMGLDALFGIIAEDNTLLGFILRYVRYASVGLTAAFLVPLIFIKTGLAKLR